VVRVVDMGASGHSGVLVDAVGWDPRVSEPGRAEAPSSGLLIPGAQRT